MWLSMTMSPGRKPTCRSRRGSGCRLSTTRECSLARPQAPGASPGREMGGSPQLPADYTYTRVPLLSSGPQRTLSLSLSLCFSLADLRRKVDVRCVRLMAGRAGGQLPACAWPAPRSQLAHLAPLSSTPWIPRHMPPPHPLSCSLPCPLWLRDYLDSLLHIGPGAEKTWSISR